MICSRTNRHPSVSGYVMVKPYVLEEPDQEYLNSPNQFYPPSRLTSNPFKAKKAAPNKQTTTLREKYQRVTKLNSRKSLTKSSNSPLNV